jgi:toxin ParE1/3/4
MYTIKITEPARKDLENIVSYISHDLQNPISAKNTLSFIVAEICSLSDMPERYPLVKDNILAQKGFRILPCKNYLVFYIARKGQNTVVIQRILSSRRDWVNFLL